jgi:hypothetical protein
MTFRRDVQVRPNGLKTWQDALTGDNVAEVDDNVSFDMVRIRVDIIHKAELGDEGYRIQQAGANYQLPTQVMWSSGHVDHKAYVEVIGEQCEALAAKAIKMTLEDVYFNQKHRHIKTMHSPSRLLD